MADVAALRDTARRCSARLIAADGLATMEVTTGPSAVGLLLAIGGVFYVLGGYGALGRWFATPSDTDSDEPGT